MKQKFTKNDLIRFIYKETTVAETLAIHEALNNDLDLQLDYRVMLQGYRQLPRAKFSPSKSAIQNILSHSQRTALEAHS